VPHLRTLESRSIRLEARRENAERLALIVPVTGGADVLGFPAILHTGRCARPRACGTRSLISHHLQPGLLSLSHRGELVTTSETDNGLLR
jgi:hypothetical protein